MHQEQGYHHEGEHNERREDPKLADLVYAAVGIRVRVSYNPSPNRNRNRNPNPDSNPSPNPNSEHADLLQ